MGDGHKLSHGFLTFPTFLTFILLVFLTLPEPTLAQLANIADQRSACNQNSTDLSPTRPILQPWAIGRMFSISTKGLITSFFVRDKPFIESTRFLQSYVDKMEYDILNILKDRESPNSSSTLNPCNFNKREPGAANAMVGFVYRRPPIPLLDASCITEFIGTPPGFSDFQIYNAMRNRYNSIFSKRNIIADVILGNWTTTDITYDFTYNTTSKRCRVNNIGGLRDGSKWYIQAGISNAPRSNNLARFERQELVEFLHVEKEPKRSQNQTDQLNSSLPFFSVASPLRLTMSKRPEDDAVDQTHVPVCGTTTILVSKKGDLQPSFFAKAYLDQLPALIDALDKADSDLQQADDALTISSLSILLLPLVLNVIPLATFTHASTTVMFIYTLMSDVVTVIPLIIKGSELIKIGRKRHYSTAIHISSAVDGSFAPSAAMEVWSAECRAKRNVGLYGVIFVLCGFGFMVLGIALEIFFRSFYVRRRKIAGHIPHSFEEGGELFNGVSSYESALSEAFALEGGRGFEPNGDRSSIWKSSSSGESALQLLDPLGKYR